MSLLWIDACENLTPRPEWSQPPQSVVPAPTGNGWRFSGNTGSNTGATRSMTPSSMIILGFRHNMTEGFNGSGSVLDIKGDGGVTNHLNLWYDTQGHMVIKRGGTILGTSVQTMVAGVWRYVEVKASVADAGGVFIVKVDGVEWLNFTGDTKNAGTSTNIDAIRIGCPSSTLGANFDDFYCCNGVDATATEGGPNNDFLGDHKVEARKVVGNGSSSQWVGTDADSVDNYLHVDETVPSTTDYVASSVVGAQDLYTVQDLDSNTGSVKAVQVLAYAQKSDAGGASLKTLTKKGATVSTSPGTPLSITWTTVASPLRPRDPDGMDWTISTVNAIEIGVEVG